MDELTQWGRRAAGGAPKAWVRVAPRELARRDPVMAALVQRHGPLRLGTPSRDRFESLARAIVFQQLAGRAAQTIYDRFALAVGGTVDAAAVLAADPAALRGAGLSAAKAASITDLAERVDAGRLRLGRLGNDSDEEVIARLTQVRGIGRWTAEMFLMFQLRRPDVWPVGDYGVRSGFGRAYGLDATPDPKALATMADHLAPFRSAAAWYCWRAAEDRSPPEPGPASRRGGRDDDAPRRAGALEIS